MKNMWKALMLATLGAFVIGGGICGLGVLLANNLRADAGIIMTVSAIPLGFVVFVVLLVLELRKNAQDNTDSDCSIGS